MSEKSENITIPRSYYDLLLKKDTATPLLTSAGYFARYRQNMQQADSCRLAWVRTEGELLEAFGLRRFQDFQTFKNALTWERRRVKSRRVMFHESLEIPA